MKKYDVWKKVIEDMTLRRALGIRRYGQPLMIDNGRQALVDLYQELLDAVVYLRQYLLEQGLEDINDQPPPLPPDED